MRRSSKGFSKRTEPETPKSKGTIKSIERQRNTGSIAPNRDAAVQADTGFTRSAVTGEGFDALGVGDHVEYDAAPTPDRPGYADATVVHMDADTNEPPAI